MAEKKDKIDSFFDILDEGAKKLEGTLKHAHHPEKDYDAIDAEVIAFETQSQSSRVRQMATELSEIARAGLSDSESNREWARDLKAAVADLHRVAAMMEGTPKNKLLPRVGEKIK
jgi:hypothetical protein